MSGLSVSLLLIVSAIAVALWRYRQTKALGKKSSGQARQSEKSARTDASSESRNGDVNVAAHVPVDDACNADRDCGRDEQAPSQTPTVTHLADRPTTEETLVARQDMANVNLTTADTTAALATRHIEPTAKASVLRALEVDRDKQQLYSPAQVWGATDPPDQAAKALLAAEKESPALQSLPDATNQPKPSLNITESHRDAIGLKDELTPSSADSSQQRERSDLPADGLGVSQPEKVRVPIGVTDAVDRSSLVANVPEPDAELTEANVAAPAATPQHTSEIMSPFDLGVVIIERAATGPTSAPNFEPTITVKQQAVVAAKPAEENPPAREIGRAVANHEHESATGRTDDLRSTVGQDTAQFQHPTLTADSKIEESPSADLKLEGLKELLRIPLPPPARQAVHRDRRGRKTLAPRQSTEPKRAKRQSSLEPSAEARIRLVLHPIRRTIQLALILLRPAGFPEQVMLELNGSQTIDALEEGQYGDVNLTWDADLLLNEIRVSCAEGYQWVRSGRPVHIFTANPAQAGLVSVPAAKVGIDHMIICPEQDAHTVCDIAESAGSARPRALRQFSGIPNGWVVLDQYHPTRAAVIQPVPAFSPLDPGQGIEITLHGGLEVGHNIYAQGRPPSIRIEPMLDGISVHIGGVIAEVSSDGHWEASGWDTPGRHRIEVVPGPSRSYEIKPDPDAQGGWIFWNAHDRRTAIDEGPWARAQICGALLAGPSGERVLAAELQPTILALGIDGTVSALRPRAEAGVSVGFGASLSAFLLVSSGRRRRQGKVVWLGLPQSSEVVTLPRQLSRRWIEAVRGAAARRLTMQADEGGVGQLIWQKLVLVARSAKRQRHG